MAYNTDHLRTAGKITVYTTLLGVLVFGVVFVFNLGTSEIRQAVAQQNATTSVTVLNTPPQWTVEAQELIGSSTTTPTNAGDTVTWVAVGTDSNAERYYLLICDGNATPTPTSGAAPTCGAGDIQWAVSASTTSGTQASVSTTTAPGWAEVNVWYAWICDGNAGTPRCNASSTQGTGTTSSPFEVNHRPLFDAFTDDSPADPGAVVIFTSSSTDTDVSGIQDTVKLFVCSTASFNIVTDTCDATTLASTSVFVAANATATYSIVIPTQDQNYGAYGYIIDSHGFESAGISQGTSSVLTVNNVAPTISSSTISVNGGADMVLTVEAGETTGFTLQFTADDNNSCENTASTSEIVGYALSLYRSGVASTTCTTAAGAYNANNCYPSGLATTTWNLSCTASSTSCTGATDTDQVWDCTFPLWYIADPTDGVQGSSTQYGNENWLAQVQAIDDDVAAGSLVQSALGVNVTSLLAFALNTLSIPYGSLEPGQQTDPITATSTISATGNVGLDKDVQGESMCTTYSGATPCAPSASSTIPESEQVFATSTVAYAAGTPLSSTTAQEIEINVPKSTATSTQATSTAYWGIRVPGTITFSGDYTGENTFTAIVGESVDW